MPDAVWDLSDEEYESQVRIDSDKCIYQDKHFLRGVAYIPIKDCVESFGWGVWVEVDESDFFNYMKKYDQDNSNEPVFIGLIANEIPKHENTLGLKVEVQLGDEDQRPTLTVKDKQHQLYTDQRLGITLEKVHQIDG